MEDELVQRADAAGVITLTLNRPLARNAMSMGLMAALQTALDGVAADESVRVVVLAGAGPGFCSGHDLKEMTANNRPEFIAATFDACSQLMQSIVRLPQPVIARVHGIATAAGCQLVASCDLAIASEEARFATPGVNIGLFCSTPMVALSRNVAPKHAMEMLLTGEMVTAAKAAEIGLINRVVPADELDDAVTDLAKQIATKSSKVVKFGKGRFYSQLPMDLTEAYTAMTSAMVENMTFTDAQEGISAFIEKRVPDWKNP
ncbi:MAG: enoyl-CoA hydratase [Proteobacteria bacterium]|nr:enoyl-CoA hydratase [Pseudomonadota bacterium]